MRRAAYASAVAAIADESASLNAIWMRMEEKFPRMALEEQRACLEEAEKKTHLLEAEWGREQAAVHIVGSQAVRDALQKYNEHVAQKLVRAVRQVLFAEEFKVLDELHDQLLDAMRADVRSTMNRG